ncbi:MAG: hypothetical protein U5K27_02715 [Desulfotignum sp.]|nr:hypothetical protein [Desulfotignum sp.]
MESSGQVAGTYIHGFFDAGPITEKWLSMIGLDPVPVIETDIGGGKRQKTMTG